MNKKILIGVALDVLITIIVFVGFAVFFLPTLQSGLFDSYETVELAQSGDYTYSTVGSTSSISLILFLTTLIALVLFSWSDTLKFYLAKPKLEKRLVLTNTVLWVVFSIVFLFMILFLQEVYLFFSLLLFFKVLFFFLGAAIFTMVLFLVLLVGKKRYWHKKVVLKQQFKLWAAASVLVGLLVSTTNGWVIAFALVLLSVLYNYTLFSVIRAK